MAQLVKENCPLLVDVESLGHLLERFNAIDEVLTKIREKPRLLSFLEKKSEDLESESWMAESEDEAAKARAAANIVNRVASLEQLFRKERFRVGFVGRSQIGKSSAVNAVVGFDVLPYGAGGKACTSAVTRLQFYDPDRKNISPQITPVYQTVDECTDRIRFFGGSKNLGLLEDDHPIDVDELLTVVRNRLQETIEGDEKDLLEKLEVVLLSKQNLGHLLDQGNGKVSSAKSTAIQFENVDELVKALPDYVQFRPGTPDQAALYREVTVRVPAENVSSTLEIIDLPGLGSTNYEDDELTLNYVGSLEGLVVFTEVGLVANVTLKPLIEALKTRVGNTAERAWLTVSMMDQIKNARESYYSDNHQDTIFETIIDTTERRALNPECVRFLCTKVEIDHEYVPTESLDREKRWEQLKVRINHDGNAEIPPALNDPRYLRLKEAFKSLLDDGGIGEIKNICRTTIAKHVKNAEIKRIRVEVESTQETLIDLIKLARNANARDVKDAGRIVAWASIFNALPRQIASRNNFYETALKEMVEELWKVLTSLTSHDPGTAGLPDFHKMISRQLSLAALDELTKRGGVISKAYGLVQNELRSQAENNELLKDDPAAEHVTGVNPIQDLIEKGERFREQLEAQLDASGEDVHVLIQDLRSFQDSDFVSNIATDDYKAIMERKIESTIYALLQRIHNQIGRDCNALFKKLRTLGSDEEGVTQKFADDAFFDAMERKVKLEVSIA